MQEGHWQRAGALLRICGGLGVPVRRRVIAVPVRGRCEVDHFESRVPFVTGYNLNNRNGYLDQATNVFRIMGTQRVSVAPDNPNWTP